MFALSTLSLDYEFVIWLFAEACFGFSNFVLWSASTGPSRKTNPEISAVDT
jgi:hypothetical protein